MLTSRGGDGGDVLPVEGARSAPRRTEIHCSALVLALVGGGNIIGWTQANAAFVGIIILADTPTLPGIDDGCVHGIIVLFWVRYVWYQLLHTFYASP